MAHTAGSIETVCYHCGEDCQGHVITADEKVFCCDGCVSVYRLLTKSGLCDYYAISHNPGISQKMAVRPDKFAFLDDADIQRSLVSYHDNAQTHAGFYLPQMHCSSCLWLLENLHRFNSHIISSRTNFSTREVYIVFDNSITLRQVAELLTSIGYEPYISLQDLTGKTKKYDRSRIFKLGIAGFCFANIMLLSFPEYLGIDTSEQKLLTVFRYLNTFLSLPVLLYSSSEFYMSAWRSLKQRYLNIDAPIVLAILVTFTRSLYEVLSGTGSGYFDSMTGIVFFMLVGRVLQNKTHTELNFERDYTAYFPVAVTRLQDKTEQIVTLPEIRLDDTLLLHAGELIPADGILTKGRAVIDYSFVTGESVPVVREMGEIIYAGGKQLEASIEMMVIREVNQSYLTRLWNRSGSETGKEEQHSFVNALSRHFTLLLLAVALFTGVFWYVTDPSRVWNAVTAILIVACPCALLLSNTFTNGNILRILSRNGLYLKNAQVIEHIGKVDHIILDKTGTLTRPHSSEARYQGEPLSEDLKQKIAALASQSTHPMSRSIVQWAGGRTDLEVMGFREVTGQGIEGIVGGDLISLGAASFVHPVAAGSRSGGSEVHLSIEDVYYGMFRIRSQYREGVPALLKRLQEKYTLSIVSGDNDTERAHLHWLLGHEATLLFNQSPSDKLAFVKSLQEQGKTVMMVGDGLNDAGALAQADAGIAMAEHNHTFTPASDGILEAGKLTMLDRYIRLCRYNRQVVMAAFMVSIAYNVTGLFFAVQAMLSPMIAAILMPASSLSILLITFGSSNYIASRMKFT